MVYQLAYVSRASGGVERSGLVELLTSARSRNQALEITGVLVYRQGRFLQLLEGPAPAVATVYRAIQLDRRHTDVQCVQAGHGVVRWFSEWSMGFRDLTDDPVDVAGYVNLLTDTAPTTPSASGSASRTGSGAGAEPGRWASSTLYELWQLLQGDPPETDSSGTDGPAPRRPRPRGPRAARTSDGRAASAAADGPVWSEVADGAGTGVGRDSARDVGRDAGHGGDRASALASLAANIRRGLLRSGRDGSEGRHPAS